MAVAPPAVDELVIDVEAASADGDGCVGVVRATGERVLVGPVEACGECDMCRRGHPALCPSRTRRDLRAAEVVVRARWVTPLTGALAGVAPGPRAALIPGAATLAYTMLARAGVGPGDTVLWLGGGVARLGLQIAAAKGASAVRVEGGATAEDLRARLGGEPGSLPWKVMDASGRGAGLAFARWGANVVLLGQTPLELPAAALAEEATILCVVAPHPDLVVETAALVGRGELSLDHDGGDELAVVAMR